MTLKERRGLLLDDLDDDAPLTAEQAAKLRQQQIEMMRPDWPKGEER